MNVVAYEMPNMHTLPKSFHPIVDKFTQLAKGKTKGSCV